MVIRAWQLVLNTQDEIGSWKTLNKMQPTCNKHKVKKLCPSHWIAACTVQVVQEPLFSVWTKSSIELDLCQDITNLHHAGAV